MKLHSALLLVAGLMIGCQQPGLSADSPDANAINFVGTVFNAPTSEAPPYMQYISINAEKGEVVYDYHTRDKFPPCKEVGRLICVWGYQLSIMVPEDWAKREEGWSFRSVRFRVVSKFYYYGELDTILVEARASDWPDPTYYMYSLKRGLVGFRLYYSGGLDPKAPPLPVDYARLW
jgi:hypothetical protein